MHVSGRCHSSQHGPDKGEIEGEGLVKTAMHGVRIKYPRRERASEMYT